MPTIQPAHPEQLLWLYGCDERCEHCGRHGAGLQDDILRVRGLSRGTWTQYRSALRKLWSERGDGDPGSLTFPEYKRWQARRLVPGTGHINGPTLAPSSLAHYDKIVYPAYEWALDMGLIQVNPFEGAKRARASKPVPRDLPLEAVEALFDYIDGIEPRDQAVIKLQLMQGMRPGEVSRLRREKIRFGPEPTLTVRGGKTVDEQRIALHPDLAADLSRLVTGYPDPHGPLIEDRNERGKHVLPHWISTLTKRIMTGAADTLDGRAAAEADPKLAGMLREVAATLRAESAYSLRHTVATLMRRLGVPVEDRARLLRHSPEQADRYSMGAADVTVRKALHETWAVLPVAGSRRQLADRPPHGRPVPGAYAPDRAPQWTGTHPFRLPAPPVPRPALVVDVPTLADIRRQQWSAIPDQDLFTDDSSAPQPLQPPRPRLPRRRPARDRGRTRLPGRTSPPRRLGDAG